MGAVKLCIANVNELCRDNMLPSGPWSCQVPDMGSDHRCFKIHYRWSHMTCKGESISRGKLHQRGFKEKADTIISLLRRTPVSILTTSFWKNGYWQMTQDFGDCRWSLTTKVALPLISLSTDSISAFGPSVGRNWEIKIETMLCA